MRLDLSRQRRGEEQRLPIRRQRRHDLLHVGPEAHVHHAIGFVQHQHLHPNEVGVAVPHVIHQPARRRHHDVDAGLQRAFLRAHLDAAEHRRGGHRRVIRQADQRILDLHRQLARRREDQRARVIFARRIAVTRRLAQQPLDDRRRKRERLARAGLRAGHHVVALERHRDDRALHRARALEAERVKAGFEPRVEAHRVERNRRRVDVDHFPRQIRQRRRRTERKRFRWPAAAASATATTERRRPCRRAGVGIQCIQSS